MKQLVIFQNGSITPKDKERMSKEGYIAVELSGYGDPAKVIIPSPGNPILTTEEMLMAAMAGVMADASGSAKSTMLKEMHRRMLAKELLPTTNPTK